MAINLHIFVSSFGECQHRVLPPVLTVLIAITYKNSPLIYSKAVFMLWQWARCGLGFRLLHEQLP
jgi:hypothetical protein